MSIIIELSISFFISLFLVKVNSFDYDLKGLETPNDLFGACCEESNGKIFAISHNWDNQDPDTFDCIWKGQNIQFEPGYMKMIVDDVGCPGDCGGLNFRGAELWSLDRTLHYGYYAAVMKLPKNAEGLMMGSIFMYSANDTGLEHDEIDIEFTGLDGSGGFWVGYYYDDNFNATSFSFVNIDFDSTDSFNEYGFVWEEKCITWYVNRKEAHKQCPDIMPNSPGRFYMNFWPGTMASPRDMESWLGALNYQGPIELHVERIIHIPGATKPPNSSARNNINFILSVILIITVLFLC